GEDGRRYWSLPAARPARSPLVLLLGPGLAAGQPPAPAQTPAAAPAPPPESPLTLDEALALAGANPTITAARLRRAVDQAGIDVARERPNPDARYERSKETPRDALGLAQLIELGGKRGRRIDLAEAVLRTGEAD